MKLPAIAIRALKILAAGIMIQPLYFKFTAAEKSVYIFKTLGPGPYGRIGTGTLELIAAALIRYPKAAAFGGVPAVGVMTVAVFSQFTKPGIE